MASDNVFVSPEDSVMTNLSPMDAVEPTVDELLDGALSPYLSDDQDGDSPFVNEDVTKLKHAWVNEKQAPDLLPYETQLVEDLTEMLQFIEALQGEDAGQPFTVMLYQTEVERIKYLLRSYLRTRLQKVERYAMFYSGSEEHLSRMSAGEQQYIHQYRGLFETHMTRTCLDKLPESLRALDETTGNIPWNDTAVVCRVQQDVGEISVTETETVEMRRDNIFLMPYQTVEKLLQSDQVVLL
ncbi:GINS complex subunit [Dispira parvispora]|uniref:DNA replication complex GINS protein SLD5 n=1 Tax=Dispira parvispora TaxID=1520584 RepID=A0A9W8E872_9FUNG|nr:GINS complex subunit [Dispira parvispora]